jgi:hypothetical protein
MLSEKSVYELVKKWVDNPYTNGTTAAMDILSAYHNDGNRIAPVLVEKISNGCEHRGEALVILNSIIENLE